MSDPFSSHVKPLASLGMVVTSEQAGVLRFTLACQLPGVEPIFTDLRAHLASFDEMSTLVADSHNEWRTWGACFDEVVYSLVPQHSLF